MWWWRLIVFAESARRHRRQRPLVSALTQKTLLGLFPNIYSMHTGPGEFAWYFFLRFPVSSTKSKMAAKILWRTLELKLLHRFVSCLV